MYVYLYCKTNANKMANAKLKNESGKKVATTTTKVNNSNKVVKATKTTKATKKSLVVEPTHKPWSVNGKTGYRENLRGFKAGDKVKIEVGGKKVTAEFAYFKVSPVRYPEGKLFINYKGKLVKRVKESVEKVKLTNA